MNYLNYNGAVIRADKPVITADNRGFRYGDGLFETMRMIDGVIPLAGLHFERLFRGLELLEFEKPSYFNPQYLEKLIRELADKNGHSKHARIRLTVFRGEGGLYDPQNHFTNCIIQSWNLPADFGGLNENGLTIDVFPDARIACDIFSNIKSNNYLPYVMGALYAKKNQLNDCLLLNANGNIADATIANVFIVKNKQVITPPLSEGCVSGVMRKHIISKINDLGLGVDESQLTITDIREADEVFLSNAVYGIKWVKQFQNKLYTSSETTILFNSIIRKVF